MARVNITVPVMWTADEHGQDTQNEIERIEVRGGFQKTSFTLTWNQGEPWHTCNKSTAVRRDVGGWVVTVVQTRCRIP